MVAVRDLFQKYKNTLIAPQKTIELEAVRVLGEVCNLKLKEEQVKYTPSSRTLVFVVSSLLKQAMKINQNKIFTELKKRLGPKNSPTTIL